MNEKNCLYRKQTVTRLGKLHALYLFATSFISLDLSVISLHLSIILYIKMWCVSIHSIWGRLLFLLLFENDLRKIELY